MESTASNVPVRAGPSHSADDSSASSSGTFSSRSFPLPLLLPHSLSHLHGAGATVADADAGRPLTEDGVRKFQKTDEHGSRLRKTSASHASTALHDPNPTTATTTTTTTSTALPLRGRNKGPLGPRERPHDFSKQR